MYTKLIMAISEDAAKTAAREADVVIPKIENECIGVFEGYYDDKNHLIFKKLKTRFFNFR